MKNKPGIAVVSEESKTQGLNSGLMTSSLQIGVTREMLQQAVLVLHHNEPEAPRQKYYWS